MIYQLLREYYRYERGKLPWYRFEPKLTLNGFLKWLESTEWLQQ